MARLAIDARAVGASRPTGVDHYVVELAEDLPRAAAPDVVYVVVDRRARGEALDRLRRRGARVVRVPVADARLYRAALVLLARLLRLDLLHVPVGAPPRGLRCATVVTLFDLTFEAHPEFYDPADLAKQRATVAAAARADAVLAISESTRRDAIERAGVGPERIHTTLLSPRERAAGEPGERAPDLRYALCVGNVQPRKNFARAVGALARVADTDLHLVIAGQVQDPEHHRTVLAEIDRHGLAGRVHLLGYVEERRLTTLFAGAELLLFPSLYEGYGYPVVEAFALGIPVVTSDRGSLAEVAGDAAELCDPESEASIAAAVDRVAGDAARAAELAAAGRRRVRELRDRPLAERTLAVYRRVLAERA